MYKAAGTIAMILIGFSFNTPTKSDTSASQYIQRPTIETIVQASGVVRVIPGDEPVYLIDCPERHLRLHVLNLPPACQQPGKTIQFSGHIKATHTLEDAYGEWFELTAIY